jgi:hypothetical protein
LKITDIRPVIGRTAIIVNRERGDRVVVGETVRAVVGELVTTVVLGTVV